jgi:hypothetical protein
MKRLTLQSSTSCLLSSRRLRLVGQAAWVTRHSAQQAEQPLTQHHASEQPSILDLFLSDHKYNLDMDRAFFEVPALFMSDCCLSDNMLTLSHVHIRNVRVSKTWPSGASF